ncbi:MAG: hypothetical protein A2035_02615 [Nitrospirae bacterium GWA2_42_11]|nr:MAG: hypothetical protein A2035_02615 [Nitrospirae bacterium GWA2_42_11]
MPVLDWIGKRQVINHDKEVPFRLLKRVDSLSVGKSENLIIKGDNLEALKALLPYYYNKVKCIYIDPPYNTGNEDWIYNDKVNSPEIKRWLGKVVGSEGEDLSRHDKWLCMMYPRLKLLRELLRDDGVIFVSIDDDEQHHLRMMMSEIFGAENFVTNIIWQKKFSPQNDAKYFSDMHDFIVVYAKHRNYGSETIGWIRNLLPRTEAMDERYSNPDKDPRGDWTSSDLTAKRVTPEDIYPIRNPSGKVIYPTKGRSWSISKERFKELVGDNRIWFGENGNNVPRLKRFKTDVQEGIVPVTIWFHPEVGHNQEAKQIVKQILPDADMPFQTPKPVRLIKRIIQISCDKDDIILDSFAGSGTTAHAVLELNKEDGGNRKFILVEMEEEIVRKVTAERVKRVIKGYLYKNNKGEDIKVEGLGGGFQFMNLDTELFNAHGLINDDIGYTDLARYIFFSETRLDLREKAMEDYFIGENKDIEYYLVYKKDKKNVLNRKIISTLKKTGRQKIVYADSCTLDAEILAGLNITFKQIPYEVRGF